MNRPEHDLWNVALLRCVGLVRGDGGQTPTCERPLTVGVCREPVSWSLEADSCCHSKSGHAGVVGRGLRQGTVENEPLSGAEMPVCGGDARRARGRTRWRSTARIGMEAWMYGSGAPRSSSMRGSLRVVLIGAILYRSTPQRSGFARKRHEWERSPTNRAQGRRETQRCSFAGLCRSFVTCRGVPARKVASGRS